jgi:hypothetical protein
MVVKLDAGRDAVRAYVSEQAARGVAHVTSLVRADREAMAALIEDLGEADASFKPRPDEYSVLEVLQHLNGSFVRSHPRLRALSSGEPFRLDGPPPSAGGIPDEAPTSFEEVRRYFLAGEDEVLAILGGATPDARLDTTAGHADYGPFNWLEWAVYSHHVHTHDHVGQVERIRAALTQHQRRDALRSYIREQASLGIESVKALLRRESDSILSLTEGLGEDAAAFSPAAGEWSTSQVMQHLVRGYTQNRERIAQLSGGQAYDGPPVRPGALPDTPLGSFADVRRLFIEARDAIFELLATADPAANLQLTTDHVALGSMNWLEWSIYTLDVHARDHRGQIEKNLAALGNS